jgi:dinuclear metal center YbgI/SA1388 family protein
MTVKELYDIFNRHFPEYLREDWDNDGIMCCTDSSAEVNNVLIALDVTESVVDYAISRNFDLIISHHPLIFRPVSAMTEDEHTSRKLIKLISNNISVFSFHTRADKATGGVNDILASIIGLTDVIPFGEGGMGRIGNLPEEISLDEFADTVKEKLGSDAIRIADAYNPVKRVALLGGDGKGFVRDAISEGADTYLSGRLSYNVMEDGADMGINLVEAGHYFTEFPLTNLFSSIISNADGNAYIEIADSNMIKTV